ncbi:hypothetical protein D3C78_1653650 [compost metagenome]
MGHVAPVGLLRRDDGVAELLFVLLRGRDLQGDVFRVVLEFFAAGQGGVHRRQQVFCVFSQHMLLHDHVARAQLQQVSGKVSPR